LRGVDVVSGNLNGARRLTLSFYDFPKESKNRGGCALEKPVNRPCDRGGVKASMSELGSKTEVILLPWQVRSTLRSRRRQTTRACPKTFT
jgi:hypothetical protein